MARSNVRVVVTGLGMVTPLGIGPTAFWEGVRACRSAAKRIETLDSREFPTAIACPVDDESFDPAAYVKNRKSLKLMGRATKFAVAASTMAIEDARIDMSRLDPGRCGVALGMGGVGLHDTDYLETLMEIARELLASGSTGTRQEVAQRHLNPLSPLKALPNIASAHVAIEHQFRGENVTVCTACTSGTQAAGEAMRLLRSGYADVMITGGADAMINPMGLVGFGMLGVLSKRVDDPQTASRPFDRDRDGFVMGEGGVVLVLETMDHARRRGAKVLAELIGYGNCSDAYRVTDEREDGGGCIDAMRRALADAEVTPEDIQYVNAHGTGTRLNDATEALAIKQVFEEHSRSLCASSNKSQVGHLVAAAGAVELAACVLALKHQLAPATINYRTPDPDCDLDVIPNEPRPMRLDTVISNSFGFGGQNACLVLRRAEAQ